jgi:hypothetical protein
MAKALSVMKLLNSNPKTVQFDGAFLKLIGNPSLQGSWIIWGQSGNGKTHFVLQLCKYLANFRRVAFNSMEEGAGASIRKAFEQENMLDVNGKLIIINNESSDELRERLHRKKSPHIIAIDSLQYSGINYTQYKQLLIEFPTKLFIWVSHAEGKFPEGRIANKIRYDAPVKIRVEGYKASAQSRYGTKSEPYTIWEEGAESYWGKEVENA